MVLTRLTADIFRSRQRFTSYLVRELVTIPNLEIWFVRWLSNAAELL
jgi:hypothetical protein